MFLWIQPHIRTARGMFDVLMIISVGIDVSKDKHDCFILTSQGQVLADVFTIPNTRDGFSELLQRIQQCSTPLDNIK